jgi:hypothetical protein
MNFLIFSWLNRRGWQIKKGNIIICFPRDISVAYVKKVVGHGHVKNKNKMRGSITVQITPGMCLL